MHVGANIFRRQLVMSIFKLSKYMHADMAGKVHAEYLQMFFNNMELEARGVFIFDAERR